MKTTKFLAICIAGLYFSAAFTVRAEEMSIEESPLTDVQPNINGSPGSEHFLTAKTAQGESTVGGLDTLELQPDETYCITASYRNDGVAVAIASHAYAQGVKVQCAMPKYVNGDDTLTVTFLADNTAPAQVSCILKLHSDEELYLTYDPGSAVLQNQGPTDGEQIDSQAMFGAGAWIGSNSMSGIVLPGDEYAGTVQFSFTTARQSDSTSQGKNGTAAQSVAIGSDQNIVPGQTESSSAQSESSSDQDNNSAQFEDDAITADHSAEDRTFIVVNAVVILVALVGAIASLVSFKRFKR